MIARILNIFFFFSTIFVFFLFSSGADHSRFYLSIVLSILFVIAAFLFNWLTLDGASAAILFGVVALGFGGITSAVIVLAFFISSSLLSKDEKDEEGIVKIPFRRDGLQVWSNGFWFAFWLIIWFITKQELFMAVAITSMVFSTADTWGSEVGGSRVKGTTWLFGPFKKVEPGTDGGISVAGTFATLIGAVFITSIFWLFNQSIDLLTLITIISAGFAASFIDSLLGTYLQGKPLNEYLKSIFAGKISYVDNNMTNWISSGSASLLALIILVLFA